MRDWTQDFLSRCLEGVPQGEYRERARKELEDHLLALSRDLEGAGYTRTEARAQAAARMGDPAELSRSFVRAWRRRALWQRGLAAAELLLVGVCMMAMGWLYTSNTRNFGKAWVADWGIAAIMAAALLLYAFFAQYWTLARLSCLGLSVIQLPPVFCWLVCYGTYDMSGLAVPGWLGLSLHLLYLAWGVANYEILSRFQQEDGPVRPSRSA